MESVRVCGGGLLSSGEISVYGYKHSMVPIIAASVMGTSPVRLRNVPKIKDTYILISILKECGASIKFEGNELEIHTDRLSQSEVPSQLSIQIHGSLYLIPAFLGRFGSVRFASAGGCQIGDPEKGGFRPVSHILSVLERFGAQFDISDGIITGYASILSPCEIDIMNYSERSDLLTGPLVSGATKTAILGAVAARNGVTVILNPYTKPDVTELVTFLNYCGHTIDVEPGAIHVRSQTSNRGLGWIDYELMSDISEIMTYVTVSVYLGVNLHIRKISVHQVKDGLKEELRLLQHIGVRLKWGDDWLEIEPPKCVKSLDIEVSSVGIYSDHQPLFALMLLKGERPAYICEYVWKHRFDYAFELMKLGAQLIVDDNKLYITPSHLTGSDKALYARDLRAAAVLLIAAIGVQSTTVIHGVEHLKRGYTDIIKNLELLGARIEHFCPINEPM